MQFSVEDRIKALKDTFDALRVAQYEVEVDLKPIETFVQDVYTLGIYQEPKDYNRAVKPHLKTLSRAIENCISKGVAIRSEQTALAQDIFALATIREKLHSHHWRVERIMEDAGHRSAVCA